MPLGLAMKNNYKYASLNLNCKQFVHIEIPRIIKIDFILLGFYTSPNEQVELNESLSNGNAMLCVHGKYGFIFINLAMISIEWARIKMGNLLSSKNIA